MTHNLVRGHSKEDPQFLSSKSLLCPRQCKASVVSNTGRTGISLIFPLVDHMLLLPKGSNLLNRGSRGSCPRHLNARGSWSDKNPLLHNAHCPLPKIGKGLVLLVPHFCIHPLVKFLHYLCKRKTLVKKKKKRKNKNDNEPNKYLLFFSSISIKRRT